MKKTIVTLGIATAVLFSGNLIAEPVSAQKNLDEVRTERKEIKVELSKAEKEIKEIMQEIVDLDAELKLLEETIEENRKHLEETEKEIENLENEIAKLQEEIDLIQKEIDKRNEILKNRISSYQVNGGNIQFLEVLFGASNFMDFISRISTVTTITNADQELIEQHRLDQIKIEEKQAELDEKLQGQQELREELKAKEELINEQKKSVEEGRKELKAKEKEVKDKISKLKIKDSRLAAIESQLVAPVQPAVFSASSNNTSGGSSAAAPSGYSGGKFAWPTQGGYISSHMGYRWGSYHKGIDIARTNRSTSPPIYAAEGGTVEVAEFRNNGYGNYVVINHGNGLKTVYAHLASISVSKGQSVSRGQTIGVMGRTGQATGIHLHFEVLSNGSAVNPINYLR